MIRCSKQVYNSKINKWLNVRLNNIVPFILAALNDWLESTSKKLSEELKTDTLFLSLKMPDIGFIWNTILYGAKYSSRPLFIVKVWGSIYYEFEVNESVRVVKCTLNITRVLVVLFLNLKLWLLNCRTCHDHVGVESAENCKGERIFRCTLFGRRPQQISGRSFCIQYFCCESMILHIAIIVFSVNLFQCMHFFS
jgi:hypothetical protein